MESWEQNEIKCLGHKQRIYFLSSKHWQAPQKPHHYFSMRFKLVTKTAQKNKWKDYPHISRRFCSTIT